MAVRAHTPVPATRDYRRVTRSPPPPSPPPPPPLPFEVRTDPTLPGDDMLLASLYSPPAMVALGIVVVLLVTLCCIIAGRRRSASRGGFKRQLAPMQDDPAAEETMPMPYTGNAECKLATMSKASKWKVSVRLNNETVKLSIPTAAAESVEELKEAIASACIDKVGDEMTPRSWIAGHYSGMHIEYLDAQVRTPHSDTRLLRTIIVWRMLGALWWTLHAVAA